jgi:hypothetical protein
VVGKVIVTSLLSYVTNYFGSGLQVTRHISSKKEVTLSLFDSQETFMRSYISFVQFFRNCYRFTVGLLK